MNAPITKDQFTFSLGNATYVDYLYDEPPATVVEPHKHGIAEWLSRTVAALVEWRHRQVVMQEMQMMSDRELADIGLSRADLPYVFDPGFAAAHGHGQDHIAY
jgi:uncharacterized protein YjiS (DUF1127 family)